MLRAGLRSRSPEPAGGSASADPTDGGFADRRCNPHVTYQKLRETVAPKVRGSPGCPTIRPVLPDWVESSSK